MNIFISAKKRTKERKSALIATNYGLSYGSCSALVLKTGNGRRNTRTLNFARSLLGKHSIRFNRFLRTQKSKIIQNLKKQSSWRALRIRQGLPLNGQRTHTNARTSKRWVPSLEHVAS